MKYEVDINGRFEIDLNYWSGKATVKYQGMELPQDGKNTFLLGSEKCVVGGALFSGVYFCRSDKQVLLAKLFWYDFIAGLIPFIISMIGGIIGAVIGAAAFFVCYKLMPYIKNYFLRLLVCVAIAGLVLVVILTIASLFPALFGLEA
ncbi:MAG: hypothetical protein IKC35_01290 [Clostridia bacterium]|nr:hypothetical protein [Clostridia bacterium]